MERIVFAGTPEFALASLKALVDAGRPPIAVYTQPDRPAGRGRKLTASAVKQFAEQNDIPLYQPESFRDDAAQSGFAALRPDLLVVAAYGLILPQAVLDVPAQACVNVHSSVLPRWRGAAPIQAAILAGDVETGVTLMQMTAGLDEGPVYATTSVEIGADESAGELHDRLALLGGELLVANLDALVSGDLDAVAQDDEQANYAPKIKTADAELDWTLPAAELQRRVRAYNPVPGSWFRGESVVPAWPADRIKLWRASIAEDVNAAPGTVVQFDRDAIVIACAVGGLSLLELQAPGKRRAPVHEFVGQIGRD